jgi:hypothetical protein
VRLALLGDSNPVEALNAQAQRMLASSAGAGGQQFVHPDQVAALALALDEGHGSTPASASTLEIENNIDHPATATLPPLPADLPLQLTDTPEVVETGSAVTIVAPTPRPTRTSIPTLGAPFALTGQENICDSNLPDGLLQVLVLNSKRRQLAGVEIVLTWDGGKEQFFTGLKPELGNGYADYIMTPDITYTVQLARGSDVAQGIAAPACQSASGESFLGSVKLTFQQP